MLFSSRCSMTWIKALAGWDLDVVAVPVLGDVSLFGGVGSIEDMLVRWLFIVGVLSNGLITWHSSSDQQMIEGVVFIWVVLLISWSRSASGGHHPSFSPSLSA